MAAVKHDVQTRIDERGGLGIIEKDMIPFEIRRVYFLYGVPPGRSRGAHGHKALEQFFFCPTGSVDVEIDDGRARHNYSLAGPNVGLYVPPMHWRELRNFSAGASVVVLASRSYEANDYIHDYDDFIRMANKFQ